MFLQWNLLKKGVRNLNNQIISQYKLAMSDYKLAVTEDTKNGALVTMHRLTNLAAQLYGFEFADSLKEV